MFDIGVVHNDANEGLASLVKDDSLVFMDIAWCLGHSCGDSVHESCIRECASAAQSVIQWSREEAGVLGSCSFVVSHPVHHMHAHEGSSAALILAAKGL